jgi:hypothetical protein
MRHFLLCAAIILIGNLAVLAQDAPKAEVFAGFSYGNYELLPSTPSFSSSSETISGSPSARLGLFGWNGSVAVNVNAWFSFATDFRATTAVRRPAPPTPRPSPTPAVR